MTTQELHELAKKVAPLIGYEYAEDRNPASWPNANELSHFAHIKSGEKGSLWLEASRSPGRIVIAVAWPRAGASQGYRNFVIEGYRNKDRQTSISVTATKTPEQIARDIKNRLLTDAESLYQEAYGDMIRDAEYNDAKRNAAIKVAALTGNEAHSARSDRDVRYSYNLRDVPVYTNIEIRSATNIRVEIDADVDNIEKIIEFVKSLKKSEVK